MLAAVRDQWDSYATGLREEMLDATSWLGSSGRRLVPHLSELLYFLIFRYSSLRDCAEDFMRNILLGCVHYFCEYVNWARNWHQFPQNPPTD